jgi:condensin complex subunit 3
MLSVRTSRDFDWTLAHIQIFTDTLESLAQMCEEAENDQPMLPIAQMGLMMVDWLDPQKVV